MTLQLVQDTTSATPDNMIHLQDGIAECMGQGLFIVFQTDDQGVPQSLVLTETDLRIMLAYRDRRVALAA